MCGICGQFNYLTHEPVQIDLIKRMTQSMTHRGPDDEGFYISNSIGFGFRRLSIIDLAGGHQPMSDHEGSIWVIFNGEIYNFPELKAQLESFGHHFRTKSDTEVIVYGYKQWGIDVFNRLNGMFGLGIYDALKKRLILARDAMGIKPLYYTIDNGRLFFGSEIKSILSGTRGKVDVDRLALNLFLRYRYTPAPLTLFQGIKKLAAGTMFIAEKGQAHTTRWYNYKPTPFSKQPSFEEASEELRAIYKRAVKRQLLSDVPVGILLSGGVDSGLLLGLMNLYGNNWPSFTIGYGDEFKDDELSDARESAKYLSSVHSPILLNQDLFENSLPNIIRSLEEPVATSSIVPMYFVCERAREDVKVALIGQGPDELFGGYRRHLGAKYGSYWRALPKFVKNSISFGISALPRNETLKRGLYSLDTKDRMKRYMQIFSIMPGNKIDDLFHDGTIPHDAGEIVLEYWEDLRKLSGNTDDLGGFQFLEIRSSLPDELLMFGDKLSMAHGLEVRVPYLDKEIVEYVERLDSSFKIHHFSGKILHKSVCGDFLENKFLKRKKRGFAVNIVDQWFKQSMSGKTKAYFADSSSLMFDYLKIDKIRSLYEAHKSGKYNNYKILFSLVAFEQWLRCFK